MNTGKAMEILKYSDSYEKAWDDFVVKKSLNGTFLQTRRFLNYHPKERFKDCSILITDKGNIVAVIPACNIFEEGEKTFYSHKGSTFGGVVLDDKGYNVNNIQEIIELLEAFLIENSFSKVVLKITSDIFSKNGTDLLQYWLHFRGYSNHRELSTYINLDNIGKDISPNFNENQRRKVKKAIRYGLEFRELTNKDEIKEFYYVLEDNLKKFSKSPVHSLEELIDLKFSRLEDIVAFYGVFFEGELIAGTMTFNFDDRVLHTQYLAAKQDMLIYEGMSYLYYMMIQLAKSENYELLSWGIATEDYGRRVNLNLLKYKESFGSEFCINNIFYKNFI